MAFEKARILANANRREKSRRIFLSTPHLAHAGNFRAREDLFEIETRPRSLDFEDRSSEELFLRGKRSLASLGMTDGTDRARKKEEARRASPEDFRRSGSTSARLRLPLRPNGRNRSPDRSTNDRPPRGSPPRPGTSAGSTLPEAEAGSPSTLPPDGCRTRGRRRSGRSSGSHRARSRRRNRDRR